MGRRTEADVDVTLGARPRRAARQVILDGWFGTGDLGVRHPDGHIELRDRSKKDIIISGGENIASVEVEFVLAQHPSVWRLPL